MAWKESSVKNQRKLFIDCYVDNKFSIAELCRQFDISRPTGYKWIERYELEGIEGLVDQSKAPIVQVNATSPLIIDDILEVKFKYPNWGPKKIRGYLVCKEPTVPFPSITTISNILAKNGLVKPRKFRKRFPEKSTPLSHANMSNSVWSVDFKGWWITKDGHKCDPFTLTDNYSRYILRCLKLDGNDFNHCWAILDAAFREYGLPNFMRHDNGPPFATASAGRLSRLSVNLIKAGVIPEWIEPGNPQENGRHERMHGTLAQEAVYPDLNLKEQQLALAKYVDYFNYERPHEALGQVTPGSIYTPSLRSWNGRLVPPEYSKEYSVAKVASCGKFSWKGHSVYVGRVLSAEPIGLKEADNGTIEAYYGEIFLGTLTNNYELEVLRRPGRVKKGNYSKFKKTNNLPKI